MPLPLTDSRAPGGFMPVALPVTGASAPFALQGAFLLGGWAFVESTGLAPCSFDLIDGGAAGGTLVMPVTLGAGVSIRDLAPQDGIIVSSGLFVLINSGSVRGSLWVRDL